MSRRPFYSLIGVLLVAQIMGACCCAIEGLSPVLCAEEGHSRLSSMPQSSCAQCEDETVCHDHTVAVVMSRRQRGADTPTDLALDKTPVQSHWFVPADACVGVKRVLFLPVFSPDRATPLLI